MNAVSDAYRDYLQLVRQERWDGAGWFARIGLWFDGEKPDNAHWWS